MTMTRKGMATCPKCGAQVPIEIFDSLNVSIGPEGKILKAKLLDRSLLSYKCAKCGEDIDLDYPMLYHDMDKQLMIWNVPFGCQDEKQKLAEIKELPVDQGYTTRLVGSKTELLEKIRIFDREMDDRVIEVCKHLVWGDAKKRYPKMENQKLKGGTYVYLGQDGYEGAIMYIYDENGKRGTVTLTIEDSYYERIKKLIEKELETLPVKNYEVVDMNYGWSLIKLKNQNVAKEKPIETAVPETPASTQDAKPVNNTPVPKAMTICTGCGAIHEGKTDECKSCDGQNFIELPISAEEWKGNIAKQPVWALKYLESYCYPSSNFKYEKWKERVAGKGAHVPDAAYYAEVSNAKCPKCNSDKIVRISKKGLIKPKTKKCLECSSEF